MTALQRLHDLLNRLENRFRLVVSAKGAAATGLAALALTVLLVWICNRYRFASDVVLPVRILLFASVAAVLAFALAIPVSRINRRRITQLAESQFKDLDGRLLTAVERPDSGNPFIELLAEDALGVMESGRTDDLAPARVLFGSIAATVCALGLLLWMIDAGPGYWGYGATLLWTGHAKAGERPLYDIAVQPGNKTVRRRSNQPISARLLGFSSDAVVLHAKYRGAPKWDTIPMQPQAEGNGYQVIFPGLADSLEYYVQAADVRSKHFTIAVKDAPVVKRLRVEVHYPPALGLKDSIEDPGGDIRALQGSQARISVLTDKPLANGALVLEDGTKMPLAAGAGAWMTAVLPIKKDGSYHVAAFDGRESIRISDDYFIEAKKDEAPSVRIMHPGRDPHVSPIEEVPVTVEASDDFGIRNLQLHYSVNGGPEQVKTLARPKDAKELQGETTLYFEDFKLVPGDLVSFYATAQDATHTSRTDMVFAQAEPFDFKFRQSQQSGGMGGGGQEETKISERQKEVIAATWNELKDPGKERATIAENARFLSGLEGKLGDQAKALAQRMSNRQLNEANPQFEQFSKEMVEASNQMTTAVTQLRPGRWNDALPPEQKALQSLLRAESRFRDIQVAYGQRGGGGMGAGGEQRELARLLDLELDNSKNQYETGQQAQAPGSQQQQAIDKALERLKELARRQQELAQQPHSSQQQFQQRWEEEQLRRDAEQLREQMEQLAQNSQSQSSQQSSSTSRSGGQQASSSSGRTQAGRGAQSSAQMRQNQQAIEQALQSLKKAEEDMRNAVSNHDAAAQTRAAGQLAETQDALRRMMQGAAANDVSAFAQQAHQLAENQRGLADRIKRLYGAGGINTARMNPQQNGQGNASPEMPEMDGPDYSGGWWRRRMFEEADTARPATEKEKSLAKAGEELSRELQELQQRMQQGAQSMQSEQPQLARELRKALSDAEQEELALRMQKSSEWMREGYGSQAWPMQDSITAGLQQMTKQLDQADAQAKSGNAGQASGEDGKVLQALAAVRSLREQMQRQLQQGRTRPSGGQPSSEASTYSQRGSSEPAIQTGQAAGEAIDDLNALRAGIARDDRQLNNSLSNAIGSLRQIRSQPGRLDGIGGQDAVTSLERVEIELARRVSAIPAGARTGSAENAPEQYREALAEYFRRLSK